MENITEENSSFGIKKIIDVKINKDGKQLYKVKWEPTWEPVENLVTCQHLIDEFWSFVNIAKVHRENTPRQHDKNNRMMYSNMDIKGNIPMISEDDKLDVQRLIARTNQTPAGNPTLVPPNMLLHQNNQQMPNLHDQLPSKIEFDHHDQKTNSSISSFQNTSSSYKKPKVTAITKVETNFSPGKEKTSSISSIKIIENFEHPYVRVILVCKICSKEQKLSLARNWKTHYLSHSKNEDRPFKCSLCPKAFITRANLRKHSETHGNSSSDPNVKNEPMNQMY